MIATSKKQYYLGVEHEKLIPHCDPALVYDCLQNLPDIFSLVLVALLDLVGHTTGKLQKKQKVTRNQLKACTNIVKQKPQVPGSASTGPQ